MKQTLHFEHPSKQRRIVLTLLSGLLFSGIVILMVIFNRQSERQLQLSSEQISPVQNEQRQQDSFSYKGETGKDALTLLQEKAQIEQDRSGLVVTINGRKADTSKREFWSFYVNGKMAPVGPSDYETNDNDTIEWKIEVY